MNGTRDGCGLYQVEPGPDEHVRADVVFVHGLGGGSHSTWSRDSDGDSFWPSWLAEEYPHVRVWTLGYETAITNWRDRSIPLADLGNQILEELCAASIGHRPLVFVCHSMGGILVKQIIRHGQTQGVERWKRIPASLAGIAFIATPHTGANIASFAELARVVLRTGEHVSDLQQHSARLRELHGSFLAYVEVHRPVCRSFAERREVKPGAKVLGLNLRLPKGLLCRTRRNSVRQMPMN